MRDGNASLEARATAACARVMVDPATWAATFDLMRSDAAFGRALAHMFAAREDRVLLQRLGERDLAALWAWLDSVWSWGSDVLASGFVGDEEHARRWRDAVLNELASRSTEEALRALDELAAANPEEWRVRAVLQSAEERDRDAAWQGPSPEQLVVLLSDARRTIVKDDDDLYRAVVASLARFADRVRHVGQLLWNETRPAGGTGPPVWRPKYEPDVSAALRDHLKSELERLVVNREVLVEQTSSKGQGLSVDLLVSGAAVDGEAVAGTPQCPVEVKGCWNPRLMEDLEEQLVDDYLAATGATRGVYVTAWFDAEAWDDRDDGRRRVAEKRDRAKVAEALDATASRLSAERDVEVASIVVDVPRPLPSARAS